MLSNTLLTTYGFFETFLYLAVGLAGVVGALMAGTTRDDAYEAGDRQSKWIWVAILVASAFAVITGIPFLSWAGMVAIGIYWFDVRPHLRSLLSGNYGW
ncbi:DUF2516 family protein [Corynebacterium halotolerans]|uniref:Putative secreted protein n=1 Tax=Corynebacterium halotolerans YIM 70093 = DSM 44683 TaxID=1121362 RepID=M1NV75_9CORY|nr:DUF2516 family protein [Corynebacterium halotolerans]AGF71400.1 putative secreted protein [Corynebacterium halotolerans YIM 70093 = DSM 44683]